MSRRFGIDAVATRGPRLVATPLALLCLLLSLAVAPSALALPAGRAYEQVTPADKNGGDVGGPGYDGLVAGALAQSRSDGNAIAYVSLSSFSDTLSAELFTNYISSRGSDGWSTQAISPPAATPPRFIEFSPFRFFASDLSAGLLEWVEPVLAKGAPQGFNNLYVRESGDTYQVVTNVAPPNLSPLTYRIRFAGATPDLSHVIFDANDALAPGAPSGTRSVYEWTASSLRLVSVLPGPGEVAAEKAGAGDADDNSLADVISDDGSRVFWTDGAGQLYVRENGARTVKLNASQRTMSLGDGMARLRAITPDGSKAIFTDPIPLTDEPNDNGGLYSYDLETEALLNLTPHAGEPPSVQGTLGMSDDGTTVFFVATAVLASGASTEAKNLYVVRGDTIELIAVLDDEDRANWSDNIETRTARVTPDGGHVAFLSRASLTGYDNTDALTGEPHQELFVYDVAGSHLTCVSCSPSGARPTGGASVPLALGLSYQPRIISDDGNRVLFNSDDALVAADVNGRQDVYEYADGRPQLISTGTSGDVSALADMTPGGRDVFFTTREQLVPSDRDNGSDIYDARIGGGFPIAGETIPCAGEACRGPLSAPPTIGPGAATLWPGAEMLDPLPGRARKRCGARSRRARGSRAKALSGSKRCKASKRRRA
ncbi:MAG: hypothetical protein WA687_08905 [Solirubrobacterales bacterium]